MAGPPTIRPCTTALFPVLIGSFDCVDVKRTAREVCVCVCDVVRREYRRQVSERRRWQQTVERPTTAKTVAVTPKLLPTSTGTAGYSDDVNDYTRAGGGAGGGGGCVVHRPLPSLPRRMDGSWAKSVRSDASGSDASLHWDDDGGGDVDDTAAPTRPRAVRCRSVAAGTGGDDDDDRCPPAQVRDAPGCRTMPRPAPGLRGADVDRMRR